MEEKEKDILERKMQIKVIELSEQIAELKEMVKPIAPENAIGRISRMDAINNRGVNIEALRKAEIKLNALKDALQRISHKNFGICFRCNKPIPMGRLLLRPQSKSCVKCAH